MRALFALVTVLACTSPPPELAAKSQELLPLDLGPGGAPMVRLLDHLDTAQLELSPSNLVADVNSGRYPLSDGWSRVSLLHDRIWTHPSPVQVARKKNAAPPSGMRLLQGERELPYKFGASVLGGSPKEWEVADDALYVVSETSPSDWAQPPMLVHQTSAASEARMNFEASGLSAAEFTRYQTTIDDDTRQALLLPAPSRATFEVELPSTPHLVFATALAPAPVVNATGSAELRVLVDGELVWKDERAAGEPWEDAIVDLSRWADKKVHITLETDPLGDNVRDYAVFAAPRINGPPAPGGPRRIVVLGLDTTRADHLGTYGYERDTSPGMDEFASQAVVFDHAYAPAPRTRASFRTATTGRWPLRAITAPTFGEVLEKQGFVTGGIVSNVHLTPKMGFADGFEYWHYENSAPAENQVDRAITWLDRNRDEDSFLFVHFMDPHLHYNAPSPYANRFTGDLDPGDLPERFNRWLIYREMARGKLTDEQKEWISARYDGEIAYLDAELLRLFQAIDQLPGRSLVVVHSDHGEEFWEHGAYEHNHSLYDELVHAVLWIRPPGGWAGGPHRVEHPVSLADIAPTLYDIAGVKDPPESDGTSLRPFVDLAGLAAQDALGKTLEERPMPIGHLMFDTERWAVVYHHEKYILQTLSGVEELYDLQADPQERHNLVAADQAPLELYREKLAQATGWPVGPGWRVGLQHLSEPVVLQFDQPVAEAGVIDPEAGRTMRANLEWGEVPEQLPKDIAEVTVVGNEVRIAPGPQATGTIYIYGPHADTHATATAGDGNPVPFAEGSVRVGTTILHATPGTLILVRETEAQALAAEQDPEAIDALKALGYVGGGE